LTVFTAKRRGRKPPGRNRRALERARVEDMSEKEIAREIKRLEKQMLAFARDLEFEKAAAVRDQLAHLRQLAFGAEGRDLPAV
jgi:excinuclease ABC subunit B